MISHITEITDNRGWIEMWLVSSAIFFAAKLAIITLRLQAQRPDSTFATWPNLAAFTLLWPGMNLDAFVRKAGPKDPSLVSRSIINLVLGAALTWIIAPNIASPYLATWLCMIGFTIALHGGFFTLATVFWQSLGRDVSPLMACPVAASSVTEFWSKHWNIAFHDLAHQLIFKPAAKRWGAATAMWTVFIASGLVHELVVTLPSGDGYGGPTFYFIMQGLGVTSEHRFAWKRRPVLRRLRALAIIILPLPIGFPPAFIERVMHPFFTFIHAL